MSLRIKACLFSFLILCLIAINFVYYEYSERQIYKEGRKYLLELYSKINHDYSLYVSRNWSILDEWKNYSNKFSKSGFEDEKFIQKFIQASQENWKFTDFYFMNDNGDYITLDGEKGYIKGTVNYHDSNYEEGRAIYMAELSNGNTQQFFCENVDNGNYMGFEYSHMVIGFDEKSMANRFEISIFEGSKSCIAYSDGTIIYSTDEYESGKINNVKKYLIDSQGLSKKNQDLLDEAASNKRAEVVSCVVDGVRSYMVYQPLSVENGMIVGMVPQKSISANIQNLQRVAAIPMLAVFVLFAAVVLNYFAEKNKRILHDKKIELESRNNILDIVTNSTDDIYVILTKDCVVEYVSPNIKRILGLEREAVKENIDVLMNLTLDDVGAVSAELLNSLAKGEKLHANRYMINEETKEGKWYYEIIAHVEDNNKDSFILLLSDRTKEQRVVEQLQSALDSAKGANETKSLFLAKMSHEIRTPMNAILGCAELLMKNISDEKKAKSYVHKIMGAGRFLLGLLNDILDMSKIESGKMCLNIEPFNFAELLSDISSVMAPQAKAKNQKFEIFAAGIQNDMLLGDKLRIEQVLLNLISNAIKYTQNGGNIVLNITSQKQENKKYSRFCFEIKDNGMGMTQDFIETIFDPFVREENSKTGKIQGTGLGMAITKNMVELMGGNISVKSKPQEGSTFTVYIDLQTQNPEYSSEFWEKHKIRRMLIVDDTEDICINIQDIMKDTGVEVSYTTDGAKAIEMVDLAEERKTPYDLVILDYKMPGMDGLDVARVINEKKGKNRPSLILTDFAWEKVEQNIEMDSVDAFLVKPFFISSLKECIEELYLSNDSSDSEEISIKGMHFLVVEDFELNYEILKERLELEGATCEIAVDGEEGVRAFEKSEPGHFDAILMDVQMPKMNGYEATKAIRAGNHPMASDIPIIAMTANAFEEDRTKSFEAGMNEHVAKPIDMKRLKEVIINVKAKNK